MIAPPEEVEVEETEDAEPVVEDEGEEVPQEAEVAEVIAGEESDAVWHGQVEE